MEHGTTSKWQFLSGNMLKILALITMTCDHIGLYLMDNNPIMRMIGRISLPIFAYMIAEGCKYTKNKLKYLSLTAGVGLICQIAYWVTMQSLYMCIMVTFSLSIIMIYALDYAMKKRTFIPIALACLTFGAILFLSYILPHYVPVQYGYRISYGIVGIMLPVLIYVGQTKAQKLLGAAIGLTVMAIKNGWLIQWFALFALIPLAFYSGKRGKTKMKYLFYIYYPLHLVIIYAISWFL